MGKPTGFLEWDRAEPHRRPVSLRVLDWKEVEVVGEDAAVQAGRCMDCGVPFCTQGCPLGNPIPDFADAVFAGRWRDAHKLLEVTNEFPDVTGRVCPAPCEGACVLNIDNAAVTIEALEKSISERAFAEGWVTPRPPAQRTGHRVAIVGSGPGGLAAAARLNRLGHTVTVFEAAARPGGLMRYGIPDFKLGKDVLDRRLAVLVAEGVEIKCHADVGRSPTWDALRRSHDAVVIATGAARPRELAVPGRDLRGVVLAMDYLTAQNRVVGGEVATTPIDVRGQRVVILGGGDTGSDCLGTALRQGAANVTQIELMPAPPAARATTNPWPSWPLVFRTSSSQEEGGAREFAFRTTALEGEGGQLTALRGVRVDGDGAELRIPVDTLILALGFIGPDTKLLTEQLGVTLAPNGTVRVTSQFETSVTGVFCVGDAKRGASLVVWAIAEGRDVAAHVDRYLAASSRSARRA